MGLNQKQIINGFWYFDSENDFPPEAISYPEEYGGGSRLNLVSTQLSISRYKQNQLVSRWCETLPELADVRYLWFNSRVNQKLLEATCQMPNLEGLYIKWSGVKDISSLSRLPNLEFLRIGSSTQIESIEVFKGLGQLRILEIENFKKIRALDRIGELEQLEGLVIEGSMWTKQVIETLAPIGKLKNLRYLFLSNLRSLDNSLLPLRDLSSLENLSIAYWWPKDEYKILSDALPNLKYGSLFDDELIERFAKD